MIPVFSLPEIKFYFSCYQISSHICPSVIMKKINTVIIIINIIMIPFYGCASGDSSKSKDDLYSEGTPHGLGSNIINKIHVSDTIIYAATNNGLSISYDSGKNFVNRSIEDGLPVLDIKDVYALNDNVFIATWGGGLAVSNNQGKGISKILNETDGLASNMLNSIFAKDSGKEIYAATKSGLSISLDSGKSFITKTKSDGLGSDSIRKVLVVSDIIYAATDEGLSISTDGGTVFENKTTGNGL